MKIKEIRDKTDQEMLAEVKNLKEELLRLRFRKVTDEIEDPSLIRVIKKDIARLKTVLRERTIKASTEKVSPQTANKKES